MRDRSLFLLCVMCIFVQFLENGTSQTIDIQPNPAYIPTTSSSEVAITCTGDASNVGFILSISLERNLRRDSGTRNLVTMSDSSGPRLDSNPPDDLSNQNPNLYGYFQATNTSSYFTLAYNINDIECSDFGDYTCVMVYVNATFEQTTIRKNKTMEIRHSPSNVTLTLYKNGTEIVNVSENARVVFNVGNIAAFHLNRYADNASTYACFRTNADHTSDALVPFSPDVISTSTSGSGDCNYNLNTIFRVVITEDDARRKNNYIVRCSVTSGTTVITRKIYLGVEHDFCLSSPCVNGNCSNSDSDTGFTCVCEKGYTGITCESEIDYCASNPCQNGFCNTSIEGFKCTCSAGYTGLTCDTDINECVSSTSCANNSTCSNTNGSYTCTCNDGFSGDGKDACTDIDECLSSSACANNSACTNTHGSYICTCDNGFTGDGKKSCTDINECMSPTSCVEHAVCINAHGNYSCACNTGFSGDGQNNCTDINECLSSTSCANNAACKNTPGSYTCMCNHGFTGQGDDSCTDINECFSSAACADEANCTNTPGSYSCACYAGFTGDGQNNCTDVNECLSSTTCANNAECINTIGSYTCTCDTGFTGNGIDTCNEIEYCASHPCENGICNSSTESYTCTCNAGYTGLTCDTDINECLASAYCANNSACTNTNGSYTCTCNTGFSGEGKTTCTDINECLSSTACANNSACTNTHGSYTCTCNAGFTGNGNDFCTDINECLSSSVCAKNAVCTNTPGSYICACNAGFSGDGENSCTDINECLLSSACAKNAACTNTPGSYTCACNAGFTGDGNNSCTDINECLSSSACVNNAACTNTPGSYTCACNAGFTGDGQRGCIDINECLSSSACANNAVCTNTPGSYTCACNAGFTGDGNNSCTDINECRSNPCYNSGYCYNYVGSFRCYCRSGWTGTLCQTDINECSTRSPCATNATCTNTQGSYTCSCNSGFTGDGKVKCTQNVLVPTQSGSYYYRSDDGIYSFRIPGGMDYFGKRYYSAYVSMNGYITLGRRYNIRNPWTSSSYWRSIRYPIIAPLWADIDTRGGYGQTGMYVNSITSRSVLYNTIKPVIDDTNFWPRFCLMVTWKSAVPYPYTSNYRYETADFQVLLASNSSYTYVMFNYDQDKFTWRRSGGRLVVVGLSTSSFAGNIRFSSSNFVYVNTRSNVGIQGRWRYSASYPGSPIERAKALCINWYYDSYIQTLMSYARSRSSPCPCSYSQVTRDRRFRYVGYSHGIHQYRQRWTQWPYHQRQRCHYKTSYTGWWFGRRLRGRLLYGYPGGGYMESFDSKLEISDAYNNCCLQRTGLCHLFYRRNPSRNCRGYRPPSWRPANGDPHITTLDGTRYTFNGRGEYTLVDIKEENITLTVQLRTDLVNDGDPDATIFVGIAGKDGTEGDTVEVILDRDTNSSNVYISGNRSGTFASTSPDSLNIEADRVTVFNDSDKLVLAFESGVSLQVSVHNLLDIVTSVPEDGYFTGNTRGLLGNNDGDTSNDFTLRNGTVLSVNSTEEQLFDFGMSWMIDETESLFNYTISGNTFEYYNDLNIRPNNFIGDMLNNLTSYLETNCPGLDIDADAIEEACEDNVACKVDAAATCDTEFGKSTKDTEEQVEEENEVLENFPPNITAPDILYIGYMVNTTLTLDMEKHVMDSNLDSISIETSIPEEQFSFDSNTFQWNVSEELRNEIKTVYVRFTANDSMGASSEYWPDLYYCGCQGDSECDYSLVLEDNDNEDHFYHARCNCSEEREGAYCENIKDRCDPNPCYENVTCDSTQSDNPCGACPVGLSGDGLRCEDSNECHVEPPPCNQTCENIIGSYVCSCSDGYILNNDEHNCDDYDECERRETNECTEHQMCKNTPGAYECLCTAGYALSNGTCEKVISSYAGLLIFETKNKTVPGKAVEKLLYDVIHHETRIISVEMIEIQKVEADRRRREDESTNKYNATFLLHSAKNSLKTEDVELAFNNFKDSLVDDAVIDSDGLLIFISIKKDESKVYKDNEYGICNITDKVTCDLESTTCTAEDGIPTCSCKEGFQDWSLQYVSCKDRDECMVNDDICGDHGTCENYIGSYTCVCDPGFRLDETGVCTDICASSPCKNGGSCTHIVEEDIYSCQCKDGWTGFSCVIENSEADRMQLIAIAVGSSVGTVCIVLLCISVLLWRRYKVTSKGYERAQFTRESSEANTSYQILKIPRPSVGADGTDYAPSQRHRNDAYTDSTEMFQQDLPEYGRQIQSNGNEGT